MTTVTVTATATVTRMAKKQLVKISTRKLCTLYISLPSLHNCDMKLSDFTCLLYGVRELNTIFFLNLDTLLSNLTQENFTNIEHIKERQSSKQCEFTFYVKFLVCCHPEILLPWQSDITTSPLY